MIAFLVSLMLTTNYQCFNGDMIYYEDNSFKIVESENHWSCIETLPVGFPVGSTTRTTPIDHIVEVTLTGTQLTITQHYYTYGTSFPEGIETRIYTIPLQTVEVH